MNIFSATFVISLLFRAGWGWPWNTFSSPSAATSSNEQTGGDRPVRLCGYQLANKLNQVCKGIYNKPGYRANDLFYRSLRGRPMRDFAYPYSDYDGEMSQPDYKQITSLTNQEDNDDNYKAVLNYDDLEYNPSKVGLVPWSGRDKMALKKWPTMDNNIGDFLGSKWPYTRRQLLSRTKRGLSAECCRKSCRISELMAYCQ